VKISYRANYSARGKWRAFLTKIFSNFSLFRIFFLSFLGQPHTKNWRPQLLILCKLNDDLMPKYRKMFAFVSQLKAGKGLTVCMSVIPGDYVKRHQAAITAKQNLRKHMDDERVKGFVDVLITKNVADGLSHM
jgi:solute carrier family 12 (potassium/chloride transporter), member 4/6